MRRVCGVIGAAAAALALVAAPPAGAASAVQRAREAGADAYVYGYPLLLERAVLGRLPTNALVSIGALASPRARLVVLPNNDTAYTLARLDLSAEPMVLHIPVTGARYYVVQLLDAYTNVFANIGRRLNGSRGGDFAVVGPGWKGTLPTGVTRIVSPTPHVWLLGRTLVQGPADLTAVRALQARFALNPLSRYGTANASTSSLVLDSLPAVSAPRLPSGLAFYDALGQALADDPPPARDAALLRRLARYGIGPGRSAAPAPKGLADGVALGRRRVAAERDRENRRSARRHNGWLVTDPRTGRFGTDYLGRAVTALVALGANVAEETVYGIAYDDRSGRPLDGRRRYRLHFARGELPPVRAFWSVTMYDRDLFLVANPIDRYSLGDRSRGLRRNADGSLDILLQQRRPARHAGNWLPAPRGRFVLALRLYNPKPRVLAGRWPLPPVTRRR